LRVKNPFLAFMQPLDPAFAIAIHQAIQALFPRTLGLHNPVVQKPRENKRQKSEGIEERETGHGGSIA